MKKLFSCITLLLFTLPVIAGVEYQQQSVTAISGNETIAGTLTVTDTSAGSLDIGGGMNAGTGNVALIGTDGKINGPLSTTIIDNLAATNLTGASGITGLGTVTTPIALSTAIGAGTPAANTIYSENMIKAIGIIAVGGGTPSITYGVNIASVTDVAAGQVGVSFDRDFSSTSYACVAISNTGAVTDYISQAAQSITIETRTTTTGVLADNVGFMLLCGGLQ